MTAAKGYTRSSKPVRVLLPQPVGSEGAEGGGSGFVCGVGVKRQGLHLQTLAVTSNSQCGVGHH